MQVLNGFDRANLWKQGSVVSVGNFDGVHRAHQSILQSVAVEARAKGLVSIAVSFEPHPNRILQPQLPSPLITPIGEKCRLIGETGIDYLLLLPFTRELSLMTPKEFANEVLFSLLRARSVHEGASFRFGHRHEGDVQMLELLGREASIAVHVHSQMLFRNLTVSSSQIRKLVAAGDVRRARWLLGRPFGIRGFVVPGRGMGKERTVATLNLQPYDELLPGNGVYFSCTGIGQSRYSSITNVGVRPTFGPSALVVETHLLDPPGPDVGSEASTSLAIDFLFRQRAEIKFDSSEDLLTQIQADIRAARSYFRRCHAVPRASHG